jgi:ribosomal protein L7Ae-like RNA K-turn-binding protein
MMNDRIASYIGFAIKARQVVRGSDALERAIPKARVKLIIVDSSASEYTVQRFQSLATQFNTPFILLETRNRLEEIIKKPNCKSIGIMNESLARAILESA